MPELQARRFGVEILTPQRAVAVRTDGPYRIVKLKDGSELSCHALVIAAGVSYRKLDVPGADRLTGSGVYYGATLSEALEHRDRDVYIVGGANSAGQSAVYFAKYARRVTVLVRGASLADGMSRHLVDQLEATPNISVRTECSVVEVCGESRLESITLLNAATGDRETVPADALLIFIGAMPNTDWLEGIVVRDKYGFILTGSDLLVANGDRPVWTQDRDPYYLEASTPGIFVAGDVRHGATRRVASGVGEGAIAVQLVHEYLRKVV
jgi:thioredoxin reductase (NADPH)